MFQAVFTWAQAPMDLIKSGFDGLAAWAAAVLPQGWVLSFVRDGVISGVGSVIVFLPQILTLFFFILLLEDFGYMARAAFLMDRIMGGAGSMAAPSFRCCRALPAQSPGSWQRGSSPAAADASRQSWSRR
jgi:Fe2+ transport system protein B